MQWMFMLYGLGLLLNFNAETSTGVLQITDKIRLRGTVNLVQSVVSTLMMVTVFVIIGSNPPRQLTALIFVLGAYLLGKAILGLGLFTAARAELDRVLGRGWSSVPITTMPSIRETFGFAFSSNISATAILVFRESELLWVGFFLNSEAAGLYKIAYTIVSLLSVPADPLILSVYPETNRLIVQKAWTRLRDLLGKVTMLSFAYNLLVVIGLMAFGRWVLAIFGSQYVAAFPAMMALLAGLAFNYTLFWNRPILLSFGLQTFALGAILSAGFLKVLLSFLLVRQYGYVMEAAVLSGYYVLSVGLIAWRGLEELRRHVVVAVGP
jgi:O-antigen/teichoic acid export membrane protein